MRTVLHNTIAKGFKNYLSVSSDNLGFVVDRKRYEYKINNIVFKLPRKFTVLQYISSLHTIATIDLDNVVDSPNKELLKELKPSAEKLYKDLGFNYSTFTQFKNSIKIIPLN